MQDASLTSEERASLISLARTMYDRASKLPASSTSAEPAAGVDAFSLEALRDRVADLEERLLATHRGWASSLNTVIFALERSEARLAVATGEISAFRETVLRLETDAERHKNDVLQASQVLMEQVSGQATAMMDRLEAVAWGIGGDRGPADQERDPSTP